ncbi:MAG TPA: hypothetical protein VGQ36_04300 [Thermoanaerobaculia bacterium]|jgi:hypothetical protein|nr:hypothetical protein [Thermoanaerobaculia bacterium]
MKAELAAYLADRTNNPDARFDTVFSSVLNGDVNPLLTKIRTRLREVIVHAETLQSDDSAQKVQAAKFSQEVNTAVLEQYAKRMQVDLTILNQEGLRSYEHAFISSAAVHYGFDATDLLDRRWLPNDPVMKIREKPHRVEFSDAELTFDQPIESMHDLERFLVWSRARGARTVVTLSPQDEKGSAWVLDAAARIDATEFRTGVAICRSAHTDLSELLGFARSFDTAVVVLEGLVHTSASWKDTLFGEAPRLYIFATRVAVAHLERLAENWLGASCSALILKEAFGHHALVIISTRDRAQRIIAIVAEDVVSRFENHLNPKLMCQSRHADPVVDAEEMLAAWVYAYGPCSNFLRPRLDED